MATTLIPMWFIWISMVFLRRSYFCFMTKLTSLITAIYTLEYKIWNFLSITSSFFSSLHFVLSELWQNFTLMFEGKTSLSWDSLLIRWMVFSILNCFKMVFDCVSNITKRMLWVVFKFDAKTRGIMLYPNSSLRSYKITVDMVGISILGLFPASAIELNFTSSFSNTKTIYVSFR